MFFFAADVVAPFVHNLCTFGFFCYLYIVCFLSIKKKNVSKVSLLNHCFLICFWHRFVWDNVVCDLCIHSRPALKM